MTELLRGEYGFDGYVVSDSEAVEFIHTKHQVASTYEDAVRQALEAGLNVRTHFTKPSDFILPVRKLVEENKLAMSTVDQRVRDVLRVKFRMGLFDNPYPVNPVDADKYVGADKNPDFVKDMQRQSLVLLKNENNLLPLDKKVIKNVLGTGPLADEDNFMQSRYGPNGLSTISVLKGVRDYLGGSAVVNYEKGCDIVDALWPASELMPVELTQAEDSMMQAAVDKAKEADVVIAVMGEDEYRVGESRSRTSLELPGHQRELLRVLHATGKPVVLVLINGQPLTINWEDAKLPAILETWFPSYRGGEIIAETLFGDNNPSGKLTVTFPKSVGQVEYNFPFKKGSHGKQSKSGPNGSGTTRVIGALYPFGHGLSYTQFDYSNLKVDAPESGTQGNVNVSVDVTNVGKRFGEEVAQLYLRDKYSSVVTYDSQLRGFEKVALQPGETKTIHFTLTPADLELLDKNMNWTVEPGEFEVMIGASSEDIRLKQVFELKGN